MMAQPPVRFPQVIDNTIIKEWRLCHHRAFRRHFQGLTTKIGKSVHLHFGGCFAEALRATRVAYYRDEMPAASAVNTGVKAALAAWGDYEPAPRTKSEEVKSLPALIDALASYFEHFPLSRDTYRALDLGHGPLVERSFAVPIPGTRHPETGEPILYAGRCDMVAEIGGTSAGIWIIDEKTTSRLGEGWIEKWDLDNQPSGYTWGFRSYGIRPVGAIMRGIGIYASGIGFAESIQPRPEWKIAQWLSQLRRDIGEMCQAYRAYVTYQSYNEAADPEGAAFGRDLGDACHAFNRPCEFKPLCDTASPERWIDDYAIEFWDPLRLIEEDAP